MAAVADAADVAAGRAIIVTPSLQRRPAQAFFGTFWESYFSRFMGKDGFGREDFLTWC